MIKECIVLAGGLGKRLRPVVKDLPKPMALVNNRPFLEYQFDYLIAQGIEKLVLSVGYKYELIKEHFGGVYKNLQIKYALEKDALGTGGGIMKAMQFTEEDPILILNGDTLFHVNLKELYAFHKKKKADISIALRIVQQAQRFGIIKRDENQRIISFEEKDYNAGVAYINGGTYLMNADILKKHIKEEKFSIEKDFFEKKLDEIKIYGLASEAYFLDIGVPEDYKKAQDDFKTL